MTAHVISGRTCSRYEVLGPDLLVLTVPERSLRSRVWHESFDLNLHQES